jgi:hypothetical protein
VNPLRPSGSPGRRRRRSLLGQVLFASLLGAWVPMAAAQTVEEVRVVVDNDNFLFWLPVPDRGDHEYTHGAAIRITTRTAPWWGHRFAPGRRACEEDHGPEPCLLTVWEVGQQIYTPREDAPWPVPGERPYAGWLYGAATAVVQREVDRHRVRLELGVTGRPSLAETAQRFAHELGGYWEPLGWSNQIPFEPGLLVRYDYARLLAAPRLGGHTVGEVTTLAGATAGNVITAADAGAEARFGLRVPPSWRDQARPPGESSIFAFASVAGHAYLRNLFLDGSTLRSSPRVDKLPFVTYQRVGVAAHVERVEISFAVTTRSREYRTEPSGHRYSTITATLRP